MPLIQQPKRESENLHGLIASFDVRGSMLVVGVNNKILSLSADSLQRMADAMKFEIVQDCPIMSLVFSKDGKYNLFTLLCIYALNKIFMLVFN